MFRFSDIKPRYCFSCIYAIVNLKTAKAYVGSTNDMYRRKREHVLLLKRGKHHCSHLQRSFNRHGINAFRVVVLEISPPDLALGEAKWMKLFGSRNLYNNTENVYSPRRQRKIYFISRESTVRFDTFDDAVVRVMQSMGLSKDAARSRVRRALERNLVLDGSFVSKSKKTFEQCENDRVVYKEARVRQRKSRKVNAFCGGVVIASGPAREISGRFGVSMSSLYSAINYPYQLNGVSFSYSPSPPRVRAKSKPIVATSTSDGVCLQFESMKSACDLLGIPKQSLSDAVAKKRSYRGYLWEYVKN